MEHTQSSHAYIVFQMSLTQVKFVPKFYAQNHEWINNLFRTNITSKSFQIKIFFSSKYFF